MISARSSRPSSPPWSTVAPTLTEASPTGHATIAQNRLAIIDLVTGDPPITNEDRTVAVVLNGEIYNFRELRRELVARGHEFRSRGDTEVIAHLAEELPPVELARRLDGMFAFAVWDERRGRLVLGRDRLGKKPLYYWCSGGRLVFGSEIKALFADPCGAAPARPRRDPRLPDLRLRPDPAHVLRRRAQPPAGPRAHLRARGRAARSSATGSRRSPAWTACPVPTSRSRDAAAGVRSRLEGAVRRRLISDVPLGAFLSGGIDSSAVVGIMASQLDRPVQTFTIGFDDREGFDERPYARLAARRHRTEHHEFVVEPDAVDLVERLVWHHDQPFGDSSAVPTFLLSELTGGHVTVALSGDGGDEAFAGYERFAAGLAARRFAALPAPLRAAARGTRRPAAAEGSARAGGQPAALRRGGGAGAARRLPLLDQLRAGSRARSAARRAPGRLGARGLPGDLEGLRGRAHARPPARPQPAHLSARRPPGEDRPDEHGPRARGPLSRSSTPSCCRSPPACRRRSRPAA